MTLCCQKCDPGRRIMRSYDFFAGKRLEPYTGALPCVGSGGIVRSHAGSYELRSVNALA